MQWMRKRRIAVKPFYIVQILKPATQIGYGEVFASQEEATRDAQRRQAADKDNRYAVMRAVAVTVRPVPAVEMEVIES